MQGTERPSFWQGERERRRTSREERLRHKAIDLRRRELASGNAEPVGKIVDRVLQSRLASTSPTVTIKKEITRLRRRIHRLRWELQDDGRPFFEAIRVMLTASYESLMGASILIETVNGETAK